MIKVGDTVIIDPKYNWAATIHEHYGPVLIVDKIEDDMCFFRGKPHPDSLYTYAYPSHLIPISSDTFYTQEENEGL